jgi:hypothetical protein
MLFCKEFPYSNYYTDIRYVKLNAARRCGLETKKNDNLTYSANTAAFERYMVRKPCDPIGTANTANTYQEIRLPFC